MSTFEYVADAPRPTALITGASRGVGAAIARRLAPTHDLLLGGRGSTELDSLATELEGASTFATDLTDYDEVAALAEPITKLEVLVHNAGVASLGRIDDSGPEEWRWHLEVNLVAVVELTRLLLPALRTAGGHVVVMNSGAGKRANPSWGAYAASKFGLAAFAQALRAEEPSLRVTSIFPGRIDTDMQRDIYAMEGREYNNAGLLSTATVANAVAQAIETPADAHPTDIELRPR